MRVAGTGILGFSLLLQGCVWDAVGGAFRHQPEDMADGLGREARQLVARAFEGIPEGAARDFHMHIVGMGTGGAGTWVNPKARSWLHPYHRAKAKVFQSAAGITDEAKADRQYLDRLVRLIRATGHGGRHYILAFDRHYRKDGAWDADRTEFFVPNQRVIEIAERHPDIFEPVVSIHPYRRDALERLEKWAAQGVRFVKWLPNAQGMDPADPESSPITV